MVTASVTLLPDALYKTKQTTVHITVSIVMINMAFFILVLAYGNVKQFISFHYVMLLFITRFVRWGAILPFVRLY